MVLVADTCEESKDAKGRVVITCDAMEKENRMTGSENVGDNCLPRGGWWLGWVWELDRRAGHAGPAHISGGRGCPEAGIQAAIHDVRE